VKVVLDARWPIKGERSENSCLYTPGNTACELLSSFTPVAQINVFTLLLSTFTRTHAFAPARTRESARERGVVKEGRMSMVPSRPISLREARGNGRHFEQSLFSWSEHKKEKSNV
jgi:hypothetical protein